MINLQQWLELISYKITEGSDFYSHNKGTLFSLHSWNGDHDGYSSTIVFDCTTQTVYMVEICDYKNDRAYRRIYDGIEMHQQAWDDVKFVDLEEDKDFLEKATAIVNGRSYDTRVSIPLELPNDELLRFMMMAHDRDITFNQLIELAIKEAVEKYELQDPK